MRARKYNKKIELWQTSSVEDGAGGNYVSEILITSTWCQFITLDRLSRSTDVGITDTNDTLIVKLRKRNDLEYNSLNQFFKYRDSKYIVQGTPINIGFEDREVQITLKRLSNKVANEIQPIVGGFPLQLPFQLK